MNENQKIFLLINIIGGILVLGSYYFGLKGGKGADALWGGTPLNIRNIYAISMLISAVGYIVFFSYIYINLGTKTFVDLPYLGEKTFLVLFALLLGASALWMPLTNLMVSNPNTTIWISIRAVLAIVGISSVLICASLLSLNPKPTGTFYIATLIGISWFSIHTGLLDAILWPYFWSK